MTQRDRAADVLSAALYLRTLPKIDETRIAVLGDSHGGSTAVRVTRVEYERLYPGLLGKRTGCTVPRLRPRSLARALSVILLAASF